MRILFLSYDPPLPITDGLRLRTYHLLTRLAQKHEITLISFCSSEEDRRGLEQLSTSLQRIFSVPSVYRTSTIDYIKGSLSLTPFYVERCKSEAMQDVVARELRAQDYDLVFVNEMRMAHYVAPYKSVPRVIDAVDAFSNLYRRAFYAAKALRQRMRFLQQWLRTQWYETKMYNQYDLCTVVSPVDAAVLKKTNPGLNVAVVPNGVDVDHFHPSDSIRELDNTLVFVGVMDYAPNIDAVHYIANDILPQVHRSIPSARFLVVGRNGSPKTLGLSGARNVEVVGTVPDTRPFVWQSAVFVCPMRFSSGVKNKVLEAMAMAKPVVGTPAAYEGLDIVPDRHAVVASGTSEIANSITDLLSSRDRRVELGQKARDLVSMNYSWAAAADQLDFILESTVAR